MSRWGRWNIRWSHWFVAWIFRNTTIWEHLEYALRPCPIVARHHAKIHEVEGVRCSDCIPLHGYIPSLKQTNRTWNTGGWFRWVSFWGYIRPRARCELLVLGECIIYTYLIIIRFNMFFYSPRKLGNWSNLTSLFFRWVESPPTIWVFP